MRISESSLTCRSSVPGLTLLFVVSSCGISAPLIQDTLDPVTGVTITHARVPLVFYRDSSSRAAHARDFINMGPIQVNRMGQHRYFLWLGVWNTMQDRHLPEMLDGFESIIVFADGEPLPLTVAGWTPDAIGASESAYVKPTASSAEAYYEVTIDQLRVIAESNDIRIRTTALLPASYEPWDDQRSARISLNAFIADEAP